MKTNPVSILFTFIFLCHIKLFIYGYQLRFKHVFFMALRCSLQLLKQDVECNELIEKVARCKHTLSYYVRSYFWLDLKQFKEDVYYFKTKEYSHPAVNKFNVILLTLNLLTVVGEYSLHQI